ncbi:unnamed protein product [Mytilus coruscus]|uniref:Uncharacterized protein n=1 Tax=Mytilus coruscus TaxID=42192 RepID=A0A6J8CTY7_MYTCO|nr:unnamed protein product [Mytilus coruscus]
MINESNLTKNHQLNINNINNSCKNKRINHNPESLMNTTIRQNKTIQDFNNSYGHSQKGLKLTCHNIQHILPKIDELRANFENLNKSQRPDIIGMCETFLNEKKCKQDSNEINIPGYSSTNARKDGENRQGGGWIVYFDNNIKYERLTSLETHQRDYDHKKKDTDNYKKYRNLTNKLIRSSKSKYFMEAINNDKNCKTLWRHSKDLNSTTDHDIDMITYEDKNLTDKIDIVNCLDSRQIILQVNLLRAVIYIVILLGQQHLDIFIYQSQSLNTSKRLFNILV